MAKIDYSKAEQELAKALEKVKARQLAEGKTTTSQRAAEFFGLAETEPRPAPKDPVERLLEEEAAKRESKKRSEKSQKAQEEEAKEHVSSVSDEEEPIVEGTPSDDLLQRSPFSSSRPAKILPPPAFPNIEKLTERVSPLTILRKHLLWLKQQHIDDRYEQLGTTREEIAAFKKVRRLTPVQLRRIQELNNKAYKLRERLLKKKGLHTDISLVEQEQKRHKHKRLKVRDTWLPL